MPSNDSIISFCSGAGSPQGNDIYNIVLLVVDIVVLVAKFWYAIAEAIVGLFRPPPLEEVRGKVVLITGTGHGMGKQMALQYAQLGATILCWDVNEQTNNQTVKEIQAKGGKAFGYVCNVTKREEILELAQKVRKEHGFVSVVVNNAGIMPCHPLLEHTENEIRLMYDINVVSHFWVRCSPAISFSLGSVLIPPSTASTDHPGLPSGHD